RDSGGDFGRGVPRLGSDGGAACRGLSAQPDRRTLAAALALGGGYGPRAVGVGRRSVDSRMESGGGIWRAVCGDCGLCVVDTAFDLGADGGGAVAHWPWFGS